MPEIAGGDCERHANNATESFKCLTTSGFA